ncbi:MAG: glycosyltransferase family 4 protein [Patescibacteria group bacterium]
MKILYIITKSNWGGAQKNVFELARMMKEKSHAVSVALGGAGILQKRLEDEGIKTYSILSLERDISAKRDAISFKEIYSLIKREKPDILHLHSPKAAGIGALAGRLRKVKSIIVTVHGWSFNEDRPMGQKIIIAFFSWLTMIFAHKTILLSRREYEQALHFPGIKEKVALIPLGIKPPIFMSIDGARQTIGKLIGMNLAEMSKKVVIGTITELNPNKGLLYLINAIKQVSEDHSDAICVIIGGGEDSAALDFIIKKDGLANVIYLAGYIENAAEYLKAFNIFASSSLKEGLPYAILEAGCASLPVVATTVGGVPEIIEDMQSGVLVQPKNSRELAHALSFMIEHPTMRKQYGTSLREAVIQKFSLEKMVEKIESLYKTTAVR